MEKNNETICNHIKQKKMATTQKPEAKKLAVKAKSIMNVRDEEQRYVVIGEKPDEIIIRCGEDNYEKLVKMLAKEEGK